MTDQIANDERAMDQDGAAEPVANESRGSGFDPSRYLRKLRRADAEDYLDVRHRLLWLRSDHPDAAIVTEHVQIDHEVAIFKATVSIPDGGRATGHGSEASKDFGDYIEKAETKALGRALNALGYGAQFAGRDDRPIESASSKQSTEQHTPSSVAGDSSSAIPGDQSRKSDDRVDQDAIDYSWSAFWNWARSEGYRSKDDVEAAVGTAIGGMRPGEVRKLLGERT